MTHDDHQVLSGSGGYLSEKDKRKFTITAGILGAVFFFAQLVLPIVLMLAMMPMWASTVGSFRLVHASQSAMWRGQIWAVADEVGAQTADASRARSVIIRVPADGEGDEVVVADLDVEDVWLLDGGDRLWVVSPDRVAVLRADTLETIWEGEHLGEISRPFLRDGQLAVLARDPDGFMIRTFDDQGWGDRNRLSLELTAPGPVLHDQAHVLITPDGPMLFVKAGQTVYSRAALPDGREGGADGQWQPVGTVDLTWTTGLVDGRPVVVSNDLDAHQVRGLRLVDGRWERFFTVQMFAIGELAVHDAEEPGVFYLVSGGFPSSLTVRRLRGGEVVGRIVHGSGFPFSEGLMAMMFVPHLSTIAFPMVLAVVLTGLMARHRVTRFGSESRSMAYASLSRRAFSQAVDAVLVAGPVFVAGYVLFADLFDFDRLLEGDGLGTVATLALVPAMFGWMLLWFIVFSIMEGRYGTTPGKWLFGVRVLGTDLEPCGFGRALLRNLLKFVDGFFNFMVGVMVVALSEHWQRVGDMAARTVVVRSGTRADS